jgi:hypothetical protein
MADPVTSAITVRQLFMRVPELKNVLFAINDYQTNYSVFIVFAKRKIGGKNSIIVFQAICLFLAVGFDYFLLKFHPFHSP